MIVGIVRSLQCRRCKSEVAPIKTVACPKCFAPLDVVYDLDSIDLSRRSFDSREPSLWRYSELLPIHDTHNIVSLGAGFTPLRRCRNLEKLFGLKELYVKDDTVNPTNSFKDRPASVAVSKALEFGLAAVGAVSTGNLAGAVAAHAAKAKLPCYVFIPAGIEQSKVAQIAAFGPRIISVNGTYDDANRLAYIASENYGWAIANITLRPYYVEGSKTTAFELCEQLGWRTPDHVLVSVGSGALLRALWKGFKEFEQTGLIGDAPVSIHGGQAAGCAPVAEAFEARSERLRPVAHPDTIAKSIAIGDPGDGLYAIQVAKETGGEIRSVDDHEIIEAIKLLASKEGIFAEPAGAVPLASLQTLVDEGKILPEETVVCYVTGNGLKAVEAVQPSEGQLHSVDPTLQALSAAAIAR